MSLMAHDDSGVRAVHAELEKSVNQNAGVSHHHLHAVPDPASYEMMQYGGVVLHHTHRYPASSSPGSNGHAHDTALLAGSKRDDVDGRVHDVNVKKRKKWREGTRAAATAMLSSLNPFTVRKNKQQRDGNNSPTSITTPVAFPSTSTNRAKVLVRTRVEPKTFFANERTFLQWLNISVLVMFLALSLLSGTNLTSSLLLSGSGSGSSDGSTSSSPTTTMPASSSFGCAGGDHRCIASKISGALIAPVALAFMAYALFMYKKRTLQILRRETVRYDDQRGPVVLVAILLVVMIISYVLGLIYVF